MNWKNNNGSNTNFDPLIYFVVSLKKKKTKFTVNPLLTFTSRNMTPLKNQDLVG